MTKTRRYHNRSRTGCDTCKSRHMRCDEHHPICVNCLNARRWCRYSHSDNEMRGVLQKKSPPGFSAWQLPNLLSTDPFDSLPVPMVLRSMELLHYFVQNKGASAKGSIIEDSAHGCVALQNKEPLSFRTTLMFAAIHYSWFSGNMDAFERTFFYHKGQSIRHINQILAADDSRARSDCARLIATLAVIDSCTGNIAAAEAHTQGLLTLLGLDNTQPGATDFAEAPEASKRLFVTAHHFVSAVKSRLIGLETLPKDSSDLWQRSFTALHDNLLGLRLMTSVLSNNPSCTPCDVDTRGMFAAMAGLTKARQIAHQTADSHYLTHAAVPLPRNICNGHDPEDCLGCSSLAALMCENMRTNVESLAHIKKPKGRDPAMPSPWCGIAAAQSLYLHKVLKLWNGGLPIHPGILRCLLSIIRKDLETPAIGIGGGEAKVRFWKATVASYALVIEQEDRISMDLDHFEKLFSEHVRKWSNVLGIDSWKNARLCLAEMVWPESRLCDGVALRVWQKAVSAPTPNSGRLPHQQ